MKKVLLPLLALSMLVFAGCDAFSSDEADTSGPVTLTGQVLNQATNEPVASAFVRILPYDLLYETDDEGNYTIDAVIDSTMELRITATKDGFQGSSVTVLALAERVIEVPTLRILQTIEEEPVSGKASNILLLGQSTKSIGVKESGSKEVAEITFQVADSLGRPVILNNTTQVRFELGVQPGGGEFIFPNFAATDNNGKVTVNLSSGSKAGVVQIVASTTVDGREIRSLPVAVAIHGGLPDQGHFSIGPSRFNFPGLLTFGLSNDISVIVGDEYANPVKTGTAVYFTSTHGVIEGSVQTDVQGRGSVSLISANPLPADGVALITASTADQNQVTVIGQTPVLFSGAPVITVSPTTAILGQTYNLTVTDYNGNPLAAGTVIQTKVEGTKVKSVGNTNVRLEDTVFLGGFGYENVLRGPGITQFTFRAVEDLEVDESGSPTVEVITIKITGPNGALEIVLGAGGIPQTRTDNVEMQMLNQDTVQFSLKELP